jgi:hypothetical protein
MKITKGQLRRIIREAAEEEGDADDGPRPPVGAGLDNVAKRRRGDIHGEFLMLVQDNPDIERAVSRLIALTRAAAKRHPTLGRTLTNNAIGPESDFEMTIAVNVHDTLAEALLEAYLEAEKGVR